MPADIYNVIFGTMGPIQILTEEEMTVIFGDQRRKEFSRGSTATMQCPIYFKHLNNSNKFEVSFYYIVTNKRGVSQW